MGTSWLPWVLLIGGGIVIYTFFIGPLRNPTSRKLIGGLLTGDKQIMNQVGQDIIRTDPEAAARLRQKNPDLYNKLQQGNAFYSDYGDNRVRLAL